MEKLNDLRDLLKHEIQDLYSVEEQIIAAMPNMIEKATNPELKQSLKEHLRITEQQKARLDQVQQAFGEANSGEEDKGLLSRLFKTKMVCKGMQGIISEGNQILSADMNNDVMDAAIIACAQKIEHYEICGYGTAKAFAQELGLTEVERLLEQTLNEEYDADDRLTALAVGRLNQRAESGSSSNASTSRSSRSGNTSGSSGNTRSGMTQRVPQQEMEMEMASNKSVGAGRSSASSAKGTSAPKGTAGGRTASGTTGAASKTAGSRSTAGASSTSRSASKTPVTGSRNTGTAAGKSSASGSRNGSTSSRGGTSRTRG